DVYDEYYDEDKYYDYQEELEKVKKQLEAYAGKTIATSVDSTEFYAAKADLIKYVNDTEAQTVPNKTLTVNTLLADLEAGQLHEGVTYDQLVSGYSALVELGSNNNNPTPAEEKQDQVKGSIKSMADRLIQANTNYNVAVNNLNTTYSDLKERESRLTTLITNMSNAKSNLNTAKASVDSAQSKLNVAGDTLQSAERTQQDKYLSDVNGVKDAENNYENTKLDSSVASRTYEDNVRKYEDQLAAAVVKAPFDGVVTSVSGQVGDKYAGGTIVTIEDVSSYVIEAAIDEYDISKIKIGQKVIFKTNATGDEEMEAEVTEIAPRATTATTTNTSGSNTTTATSTAASYKVKMKVTKSNEALRLDMAAKINIITDEVDGVFAVPNSAINTDEDGNDYIEVQDEGAFPDFGTDIPEGEAADVPEIEEAGMPAPMSGDIPSEGRRIYVTVGLQTDYYVEVSSPELTEGMTVILSGGDMDMDDMMGMFGPMGGM
nr:HlyD family efflux transporter periplasmic adaptor subunit [Lachnospiraceae bacterium]